MTTKIPVELSSTPGIVDGSNATAITIDSSENISINSGDVTLATASKRYYVPRASDAAATGSLYSPADSDIRLSGAGSSAGELQFEPSSTSGVAVTITSAGNVGIGTTSPSKKLAISDGGNQGIELSPQESGVSRIFSYNRGTSAYTALSIQGSDLRFGSSATERMRIASGGQVSVGGTIVMDGGRLNVIGNGADGLSIGSADSSNAYRHIYHTSSSGILSFKSTANTATLSNAGAWTDASDISYKENITDINYGLDTVKAMQPRKYTIKSDNSDAIGFVAQEIEKLVPEVVNGEDGSKTLAYGELTAVLTKAIQEQQTIIEDLKTRIETLEG